MNRNECSRTKLDNTRREFARSFSRAFLISIFPRMGRCVIIERIERDRVKISVLGDRDNAAGAKYFRYITYIHGTVIGTFACIATRRERSPLSRSIKARVDRGIRPVSSRTSIGVRVEYRSVDAIDRRPSHWAGRSPNYRRDHSSQRKRERERERMIRASDENGTGRLTSLLRGHSERINGA